MAQPDLDVVVLTFNEERNLPDCLRSIEPLRCKVFVVDSGSTDRTMEIAQAAGAKVVSHPFESYGQQRNWALENLPLNSRWVLNLDADERLTPELAQEIRGNLSDVPAHIAGFHLRRRTVFMGRWIRHGGHYPNYQLRLFRRTSGRCEDRLYDQHFLVNGEVSSMRNDYIDVTGSDLATWSSRHVRWAGAEASELLRLNTNQKAGQVVASVNRGPIARKRWLREAYGKVPLFVRPIAYFLYRYFLRLGFLDGREGLIFHFLQGFWYRFLVDAVIYERRSRTDAHPGS